MKRVCFLFLMVPALWAQQQVTPSDFSADQAELFKVVTESVSAPCCQNGIPVAYHASAMAQDIRDRVAQFIREGKSRRQIFKALGDMRFGEHNDLQVTFTVPDENWLGQTFWLIGLVFLVGLSALMWYMLRVKPKGTSRASDEELLGKYREFILNQVKEVG